MQVCIVELRQTLTIRLLDLGHVLNQLKGDSKQSAVGPAIDLIAKLRRNLILSLRNRVPRAAVLLLPFRVSGDLLAEVVFLCLLFGNQILVGKRFGAANVDFQAVLRPKIVLPTCRA